jgi:hypothetical protein
VRWRRSGPATTDVVLEDGHFWELLQCSVLHYIGVIKLPSYWNREKIGMLCRGEGAGAGRVWGGRGLLPCFVLVPICKSFIKVTRLGRFNLCESLDH